MVVVALVVMTLAVVSSVTLAIHNTLVGADADSVTVCVLCTRV